MNAAAADRPRLGFSPSARRAVPVLHIVASVGLLGDSAGFLAVAIRAANTGDPELAHASYRTPEMFSLVFGIPLSFTALPTGLTLGLSSKWGVFRYPWVTGKLVLIVSVILVGALIINGAIDDMPGGNGSAESELIAAAGWDVFALTLVTGLAVYKPGRRRFPRRGTA